MTDMVVSALAEQEAIIERNLSGFVEVGNALMRIRDEELYREAGFDGFVSYLESKPWGIGRAQAYNMIETSAISSTLEIEIPQRQARELAPLTKKATPEVVKQVYEEAEQEAAAEGKPLTAKRIREHVAKVLPPEKKPAKVNNADHAKIIEHVEALNKLGQRWTPEHIGRLSQTTCRREHAKIQETQELLARMSEAYAPRLESLPVVPKGARV